MVSGIGSPSSGQERMFTAPSRSDTSSGDTRWSTVPRPRIAVTVALARSTSAIAFASCRLTHAVPESDDTVGYSGSRFSETGKAGIPVPASSRPPKMRMSAGRGFVPSASNARKSAVRTSACSGSATVVGRAMTLTLPSGSTE